MKKRDANLLMMLLFVTMSSYVVSANNFDRINLTEEIVLPVNTAEDLGTYQDNVSNYIPDDVFNGSSEGITTSESYMIVGVIVAYFILLVICIIQIFKNKDNRIQNGRSQKEEDN